MFVKHMQIQQNSPQNIRCPGSIRSGCMMQRGCHSWLPHKGVCDLFAKGGSCALLFPSDVSLPPCPAFPSNALARMPALRHMLLSAAASGLCCWFEGIFYDAVLCARAFFRPCRLTTHVLLDKQLVHLMMKHSCVLFLILPSPLSLSSPTVSGWPVGQKDSLSCVSQCIILHNPIALRDH